MNGVEIVGVGGTFVDCTVTVDALTVVAVKLCTEVVPVTVKSPLTVHPVTELITAVKSDCPLFCFNVKTLLLYVKPVTYVSGSIGKFW